MTPTNLYRLVLISPIILLGCTSYPPEQEAHFPTEFAGNIDSQRELDSFEKARLRFGVSGREVLSPEEGLAITNCIKSVQNQVEKLPQYVGALEMYMISIERKETHIEVLFSPRMIKQPSLSPSIDPVTGELKVDPKTREVLYNEYSYADVPSWLFKVAPSGTDIVSVEEVIQ